MNKNIWIGAVITTFLAIFIVVAYVSIEKIATNSLFASFIAMFVSISWLFYAYEHLRNSLQRTNNGRITTKKGVSI